MKKTKIMALIMAILMIFTSVFSLSGTAYAASSTSKKNVAEGTVS